MKHLLLVIFSLSIVLVLSTAFAQEFDFQNVAQIKWLEFDIYSKIPVFQIQVTDVDMNKNPDKIEKFKIRSWSDADPIGIILTLYETEKNSGIFDSLVYFSEHVSSGQRLQVNDGGVVTAMYEDHTLPSSFSALTVLEISDSMTVYYPIENPLESKNSFIRIEDETFQRQSLLTGETISESGTFTSLIIGSLGPILIVLFVGIFAIKKLKTKKGRDKRK